MKYIFNCEVITPLFMGGANARERPELRAPSIRGALRFWFRALVGGSTLIPSGDDGIPALLNEEGLVFGTTKVGSAISVSVVSKAQIITEPYQKDRALHTSDGNFLPTGKDYLLWSMSSAGRPDTPRYQPAREYIKPGTYFDLTLRSRNGNDSVKKGCAALWLLSNLGAVGSRSNRGAGSILASTEGIAGDDWAIFKTCSTVEELTEHLKDGIEKCLRIVGGQSADWQTFDQPSLYDVLSPTTAEIWVVASAADGWTSPIDALNGIGEKLRDYRSHRNPLGRADHDAILRWLETGGRGPEIKRAVFGLPIPFRYSQGGPSDVIQSEVSDRRTSPLHIRISRLSTRKYVGVLTLFKSQFLEDGIKLQLQTRKSWQAPQPADYSVVKNFINTFPVKRRVAL